MRILSTAILCGLLAILDSAGNAASSKSSAEIWNKPPLELLSRDISALSQAEQQAFIHGAMSQLVQVLSKEKPEASECVLEWYFQIGDGQKAVRLGMEEYPDYPFVVMAMALARRVCPQISG